MISEEALFIFEHFDILYCCFDHNGKAFYVQIPRGMTNLKEIEEFVQRHVDAGLPSYKEVWSHTWK